MYSQDLRNTSLFRNEAQFMLNDLEDNRLKVILVPGDNSKYLRRVVTSNPEWYRNLFQQHWNGKKGKLCRATIRRDQVTRTLKYLIEGEYRDTNTCSVLTEMIVDRVLDGYEYEGQLVPSLNREVRV